MARFLFVVPPLVGHVNPTVSVARALEALGHEVAWAAHPRAVRPLLAPGANIFELDDHVPEERWAAANAQARAVRGLAAFQFLWEEFFIPLARGMVPGVEAAVAALRPDVLVVDQQAVAGALVARKLGLRWATFATTSAGLTDPLAGLPKVREWLETQLATLEREVGLTPMPEPDRSPRLVIAFTTAALLGAATTLPEQVRCVGPAILDRPENTPFPFETLAAEPRVLVSLGTVNSEVGERFYRTVVEAFEGEPLQIVLVAPERLLARGPANILVRPFVPQLRLLPHMQAVVCHAGHNTVCEALSNGLPLVVLPIKDDQPVVAQQVVDAGAGLRLKFGRVQPVELRAAVHRVLSEPSFRAAAARIQRSFQEAGGAVRAAELLAAFAGDDVALASDPLDRARVAPASDHPARDNGTPASDHGDLAC